MRFVAIPVALSLIALAATEPIRGLPADPAPVVFTKSKLAVRNAKGKRDLVRSDIHVYDDRIEILKHGKPQVLESMAYDGIKEAQYSFSKSPRWKSGAGVAVALGVFAIPLSYMKGKKHWLTIQGDGDYVVLKLDKQIHRELIAAFEANSGVEVERLKDEN